MYNPSSGSSSSSQNSMSTTTNTGSSGLMRYGSAPSSLLRNAVDSVIGPTRDFSAFGTQTHQLAPAHFFPPEPTTGMPNLNEVVPRPAANNHSRDMDHHHHQHQQRQQHQQQQHQHSDKANTTTGLQRASNYGGFDPSSSSSSSTPSLVRHSSSPAGFLNQLAAAAAADNGFSITKGLGGHGISRLNSQRSFTRQETLSRIFEGDEQAAADNVQGDHNHVHRKSNHSYTPNNSNNSSGFAMGSWDDNHQLVFGGSPSKRGKTISTNLDLMDSQFQFSMPETALEMATMENLLHIPQDSVPCKIRAKRGFATHPRSIAERERRTRISGKLKKLQDLVPNMDKQTSYSDMLDLAVQHIKSLQNQLQKLNHEMEGCTCGCKNSDAEE